MDILPKNELLEKVVSSIRMAGWQVEVIGPFGHPLRVRIYGNKEKHELLIYVWNITHGGKTRSLDEYRIQLTGVDSLSISNDYETLLLGYFKNDDIECIVAFDPSKHSTFGFSPSIQVRKGTLEEAMDKGIAFQEKTMNVKGDVDEVVIAFKPELLIQYIENAYPSYHGHAIPQKELQIVKKAIVEKEDLSDEEMEIMPEERRRALRNISQAVRDESFRKRVFKVYDKKCAICGIQVGLVEACHIIPVRAGGTDETINGIALCHNHHKAFDFGLIGINGEYNIILNSLKIRDIKSAGIIGGLDDFIKSSRT